MARKRARTRKEKLEREKEQKAKAAAIRARRGKPHQPKPKPEPRCPHDRASARAHYLGLCPCYEISGPGYPYQFEEFGYNNVPPIPHNHSTRRTQVIQFLDRICKILCYFLMVTLAIMLTLMFIGFLMSKYQ